MIGFIGEIVGATTTRGPIGDGACCVCFRLRGRYQLEIPARVSPEQQVPVSADSSFRKAPGVVLTIRPIAIEYFLKTIRIKVALSQPSKTPFNFRPAFGHYDQRKIRVKQYYAKCTHIEYKHAHRTF